mmetsp:Transcript_9986/g.22319  ORF Transcript_9986/g.22319 Transcript_9986/m.22319 type:complete len:225 (+) Transcript_9986:115-789(+)
MQPQWLVEAVLQRTDPLPAPIHSPRQVRVSPGVAPVRCQQLHGISPQRHQFSEEPRVVRLVLLQSGLPSRRSQRILGIVFSVRFCSLDLESQGLHSLLEVEAFRLQFLTLLLLCKDLLRTERLLVDFPTRYDRQDPFHGELDLLQPAVMLPTDPLLSRLVLLREKEILLLEKHVPEFVHVFERLEPQKHCRPRVTRDPGVLLLTPRYSRVTSAADPELLDASAG